MLITVPKLNLWAVQTVHHQLMRQNVKYDLGAKWNFRSDIHNLRFVDCSGEVLIMVWFGSDKMLKQPQFPDGSWNQRDWLQRQAATVGSPIKQLQHYEDIMHDPKGLYLCTMNPVVRNGKTVKAGHIWFVNDGFTMESHGGTGPAERSWNTPILRSEVDYVFRWEHTWKAIPNLL